MAVSLFSVFVLYKYRPPTLCPTLPTTIRRVVWCGAPPSSVHRSTFAPPPQNQSGVGRKRATVQGAGGGGLQEHKKETPTVFFSHGRPPSSHRHPCPIPLPNLNDGRRRDDEIPFCGRHTTPRNSLASLDPRPRRLCLSAATPPPLFACGDGGMMRQKATAACCL
jgi:hypothetical protein